jgi:hypothetical protein
VNLRRSRWRGAERLVGLANHAVAGDGGDDGRLTFSCVDSALDADPRAFAGRAVAGETTVCPPFTAAVYAGEFAQHGGAHVSRVNLVRCPIRIAAGLALCPKPAALDVGGGDAGRVVTCIEDSPLDPPPRDLATVAAPPCLETTEATP